MTDGRHMPWLDKNAGPKAIKTFTGKIYKILFPQMPVQEFLVFDDIGIPESGVVTHANNRLTIRYESGRIVEINNIDLALVYDVAPHKVNRSVPIDTRASQTSAEPPTSDDASQS